jgi:site-specific DNA recombinase
MTVTLPLGIYVRVSRQGEREEDRFHSPREQAERARAHARARGLATSAPPFEDIDESGATHPKDRPAMADLLARIESGELGGIVAFSLDRLSRDPSHGDWLIREVTSHGGIVTAPDLPEDIDSPTGEFTFAMLLGVARLYRRTAGARFAGAKEHATLAGVPVGPVPLGYTRPTRGTKPNGRPVYVPNVPMTLDPDTAPLVREVFERRTRGDGYSALARFLDEATDRTWTRQGVAALLRNRVYATGRIQYGGVVSEVEAGAIVDEPLWHAAQRPATRPRPKRSPESSWLLTGLARCGGCGHSLAPWSSSAQRGRVHRRYKCANRACQDRASINADQLEARVVADVMALLGTQVETRHDAPELTALEETLTVADRRLEQVMAPEARDALADLWAADVGARRKDRDRAAEALGRARAEASQVGVDVTNLADEWGELPIAERRDLLSGVYGLERVVVTRGAAAPELHLR